MTIKITMPMPINNAKTCFTFDFFMLITDLFFLQRLNGKNIGTAFHRTWQNQPNTWLLVSNHDCKA
jgi:hypothetical protein